MVNRIGKHPYNAKTKRILFTNRIKYTIFLYMTTYKELKYTEDALHANRNCPLLPTASWQPILVPTGMTIQKENNI